MKRPDVVTLDRGEIHADIEFVIASARLMRPRGPPATSTTGSGPVSRNQFPAASFQLQAVAILRRMSSDDRGMRRTYALVLLCHACVIAALWLFGRVFSA